MIFLLLQQVLSLAAISSSRAAFTSNRPWELPVLPLNFDALITSRENLVKTHTNISGAPTDRLIPRNLWIAFRHVPQKLLSIFDAQPPQSADNSSLMGMMVAAKQVGWSINLMDGDVAEDLFMETYFPDTSYLWAYNSIGEYAKVSKADLWRYAALYSFGGMYLDDDAFLETPIDKVYIDNLVSVIRIIVNN
jgi:hypothetical protein